MGSSGSVHRHRRTDSPHGVVRPYSVLSASEVATVSVGRALLRPRAPREAWSLEPSLTHRAPRAFPFAKHIHSWAFTLLQGVTEDHPSAASRITRPARTGTVPLMGFSSLQRSPTRRSRFTRRFHPPTPCVLRVRSRARSLSSSRASPSRRFAPLRAFQSFLTRPLLGFRPSGLCSSRRSGALASRPEPSCPLLSPTELTLAVCSLGPGLLRG